MQQQPLERQALDLLYVEPWHGGSHRRWFAGYQAHSRLRSQVLGLAPRHWKWRMVGSALHLAERCYARGLRPKAILASDMLHLSAFLGHCWRLDPMMLQGSRESSSKHSRVPVHLYFHENQLTHPVSPKDRGPRQDRIPAWIHVDSCLAADRIWFNSAFHLRSFFAALPEYLSTLPGRGRLDPAQLAALEARSAVLPMGMDWPASGEDPPLAPDVRRWHRRNPILLWNHRWTFDKAPDRFARTLIELAPKHPFRLILLGAEGGDAELLEWRNRLADALGDRLLHAGKASPETYAEWLRQADVLPVCSEHDFFGQSVVEALHAGAVPLLPRRLAYPEHVPADAPEAWFYPQGGFAQSLERLLGDWPAAARQHEGLYPALRQGLEARYGWPALVEDYDAAFGA
jgi:glycosyltransferase involved in cell wall biosynthesis